MSACLNDVKYVTNGIVSDSDDDSEEDENMSSRQLQYHYAQMRMNRFMNNGGGNVYNNCRFNIQTVSHPPKRRRIMIESDSSQE